MAHPFANPKVFFVDANGLPLAGGSLQSYAAGTNTPQVTYIDETEVTPNANPIILDSNGGATVWLGANSYKLVLKDSLGNIIWTQDNISHYNAGSITTADIATGAITSPLIFTGAVGTTQLATQAVTTAKIAAQAVGTTQIANGAVTDAQIATSTITKDKLASSGLVVSGTSGVFTAGSSYGLIQPLADPRAPEAATITIATPGVVSIGDLTNVTIGAAVRLSTTGALPTGFTVGTIYFIKTTLFGIQLAATRGGAAINTTGSQSGTHTLSFVGAQITIASPAVIDLPDISKVTVNDPLVFTTTGALPTGITVALTYYVLAITGSNTIQISATPTTSTNTPAAIITTGSQSGTHTVTFGGLTQSITTTGRPVRVMLIPDGSGNESGIFSQSTLSEARAKIKILQGSTTIAIFPIGIAATGSLPTGSVSPSTNYFIGSVSAAQTNTAVQFPFVGTSQTISNFPLSSVFTYVPVLPAGTYTFSAQIETFNSDQVTINYAKLLVVEEAS